MTPRFHEFCFLTFENSYKNSREIVGAYNFRLLFFLTDDDGSDMPKRFKRDYQDDPKDYLDKVIEHWIYKIPVLIDIAVAESEKDLKLTVAKRVTQVNFAQILSFLSSQTYDKIL